MSDTQDVAASRVVGIDGTTGLWDDIVSSDTSELVRRFRFSVGHFDPRVFEMDDEMLDRAWLPDAGVGRWPIRVLLGHLSDVDLVQVVRVRKAISEPGSLIEDWDEDAPIHSGLYNPPGEGSVNGAPPPIGAFVASLYTLRQWIGEWLGGLDESAWSCMVLHPQRGELSVRELVRYMAWHVEHHSAYLNLKVEKLLGPRPVDEACEPGGCGKSDCACVGPGGDGSDAPTEN